MSPCTYIPGSSVNERCGNQAVKFYIATWVHVSDIEARDYCWLHEGLKHWLKYDTKEERDLELLRRSL